MASPLLVSAPPRDTPFTGRDGRITEQWLSWFLSISTAGTVVQTLQVMQTLAEDNSTDGNSAAILSELIDTVLLLQEPARPWKAEADELRALIAAGDPAPFGALGSAAWQPATAFDAAGTAAALLASNNAWSGNQTFSGTVLATPASTAAWGATLSGTSSSNAGLLLNNTTAASGHQYGIYAGPDGTLRIDDNTAGQNRLLLTGAGALTVQGPATLADSVNFASPGDISFGSNFTPYTPALTPGGAMTASGVTNYSSAYLRMGPLVFVKITMGCTFAGTASNTVALSLPVAPTDNYGCLSAGIFPAGSLFNQLQSSGSVTLYSASGTNFPLTAVTLIVSGFYRVA